MSCCAPARSGSEPSNTPPLNESDAAHHIDVVLFSAAHTFIGTSEPHLPLDGEGRRPVKLAAFTLAKTATTNSQFAAFVEATGFVTESEKFGWSAVFRGLLPDSAGATHAAPELPWWVRVEGASWRTPEGPESTIKDRLDHPVVQVSWADARAYAAWAGGRLPTEGEWEFAARGGLDNPRFPWGDDEPADDAVFCNIWQGRFPDHNILADGYLGTSPVKAFPANGAGLFAMAGNVWEWTADPFRVRSNARAAKKRNKHARLENEKVMKGGSFLCHKSYCYRYRIAARMALAANSAGSNSGFRIAYNP